MLNLSSGKRDELQPSARMLFLEDSVVLISTQNALARGEVSCPCFSQMGRDSPLLDRSSERREIPTRKRQDSEMRSESHHEQEGEEELVLRAESGAGLFEREERCASAERLDEQEQSTQHPPHHIGVSRLRVVHGKRVSRDHGRVVIAFPTGRDEDFERQHDAGHEPPRETLHARGCEAHDELGKRPQQQDVDSVSAPEKHHDQQDEQGERRCGELGRREPCLEFGDP
jgi:hypothetical protein